MSVMVTHFSLAPSVVEGPEVISPIEMPATGDDILTPASIRASVDAQVEAIEVEPFEPRTSETSLIVYGNASFKGRTGIRAFSAKAPCPISRRPGPRKGLTSPTEYAGKL